jgi:2-polyprenyl-6-methoxyphenol hydroxylase-like FAD-dependent oxidoreductase
VRFATEPRVVSPAHGTVTLAHDDTELTARFDLVVGADGVRSTVRDLVFGPEEDFRHDFDHVVVSSVLPRLPGDLVQGDYVVLVEPGRSAHLMAMAGHDPVVFFTYRADLAQAHGTAPTSDPVAALRAVYGDFDGLMPDALLGSRLRARARRRGEPRAPPRRR